MVKFAAVHFYLSELYQGDLPLHVNLFNHFSRKDLKDYQSERDFRFQKVAVYIQMKKKKHNPDGPSWISEISESREQERSESKCELSL